MPPSPETTNSNINANTIVDFYKLMTSLWLPATISILNSYPRFYGLHQSITHPSACEHISHTSFAFSEPLEPRSNGDRLFHAFMGRFTASISPASLGLAYADWLFHLAVSPGKLESLAEKAARKALRLGLYAAQTCSDATCPSCIEPLPQDHRFQTSAWQKWPFNLFYQSFLLNQQWWHNATTGVAGVSSHHQEVVSFVTRQILDAMSPVNFVATNPDVIERTFSQLGTNLYNGLINFLADWERAIGGKSPLGSENYLPGISVAVTKGCVIYRNQLIELIQYAPNSDQVYNEPILIIPSWIMKYYILDLSPSNSLVKYLVDHGHTVFMISWHNPSADDRNIGMDDYLRLGVLESLNVIERICPGHKVNTLGYCLGGTLLSIASAFLYRTNKSALNSITLLAAQTDFSEAGELTLFIDDSQVCYLEDIMWDNGYLDTKQMSGVFQLLKSNDLIWSRIVNEYLMGQHAFIIDSDLMAWNADTTRMPARMHSEYLRRLFLNNDLFEGRYQVDGYPVVLSDIRAPIFAVSTESDHVAPWRSVYKINLMNDTEVTFLLTSGGHNAGIVSDPGLPGRHFRVSTRKLGQTYKDPDSWYASLTSIDGSWWPTWREWLECKSTGQCKSSQPSTIDMTYPVLYPAPGHYVHER